MIENFGPGLLLALIISPFIIPILIIIIIIAVTVYFYLTKKNRRLEEMDSSNRNFTISQGKEVNKKSKTDSE